MEFTLREKDKMKKKGKLPQGEEPRSSRISSVGRTDPRQIRMQEASREHKIPTDLRSLDLISFLVSR